MEDSFRVRVDKTFGSTLLAAASASASSTASSSSLSSLWCLTDEEIERREWNRERNGAGETEPIPYPPNLDGFFANQQKLSSSSSSCQSEPLGFSQVLEADLLDLDCGNDKDEDDEEEYEGKRHELVKPDDHNDEEWDIRSSIGLDCTLDFEESSSCLKEMISRAIWKMQKWREIFLFLSPFLPSVLGFLLVLFVSDYFLFLFSQYLEEDPSVFLLDHIPVLSMYCPGLKEEEDKYDKVAIGTEKADDRLYMRDIAGYWTDINFYDELPNTFEDATRDPRANHMAAKLRLQEDAEAAGKFDCLQVSDTGLLVANTQDKTSDEGVNLKSILKRKENQIDPKMQKRVRFEPGCKNDCEEGHEGTKDVAMENCLTQAEISEASFPPQECDGVPDYIRNPSKYTHYTFDDSSDIDEETNQKAYMDFLNQLNRPNSMEPQPVYSSSDLPKSITFTPKKKLSDASMLQNGNVFKQNRGDVGKEFMPKKTWPIVIAAGETQESEVCEMEEDEPEKVATKNCSLRRQGRQYRTKADTGLDEPTT